MIASQMANIVSKAFNREIICLEDKPGYFSFFLSEKDKNNYLASTGDEICLPAATLYSVESSIPEKDHWVFTYLDIEKEQHSETNSEGGISALYLLIVKWFSARFVAESFKDFKG